MISVLKEVLTVFKLNSILFTTHAVFFIKVVFFTLFCDFQVQFESYVYGIIQAFLTLVEAFVLSIVFQCYLLFSTSFYEQRR